MGITQDGPLGRELGIRLQQRHKVRRKSRVPPARFGADDAFGRDLHQTQRLLRYDVHPFQDIIQHSQIGYLAAGYTGTIGALPCTQCTFIIFQHKHSLLYPIAVPQPPCRTGTPSVYHKNRNKGEFWRRNC